MFELELLDARGVDPRVAHYRQQGHCFDDGLLAVLDGQPFAGSDAMQLLAVCSTRAGWLNRLNAVLFSQRRVARLLYPPLRLGRRAWLALRGTPLIDGHGGR